MLHGPLTFALNAGLVARSTVARGGSTPGVYGFGESFQLLEFLAGRKQIPKEFRPICAYNVNYEPTPHAVGFKGADVCLIEPNGNIEIVLGEYSLNRAAIMRHITNPIKLVDREAAKLTNVWFNKGLLICNEDTRKEVASKLLPLVPPDHENAEMMRLVLSEARGVRRDMMRDMRQAVEQISLPIGMMAYSFQFMPDGRPVFWPPEFQQEIASVVEYFSLPFFEPWRVVMEYGGQPVLEDDLRHYKDEFVPVMGARVADFAREVLVGSKRPALSASAV